MSITLQNKNTVTLTPQARTNNKTWDEAVETWDEADATWNDGVTTFVEQSKNNVTLTPQTKNNL